MVIDFGNSRTGALLVEMAGEISQTPQMLPFELLNRYHLDAWNDAGEAISVPAARWFSSKTHWCNTPYLPPLPQKKIEYHTVGDEEARGGWFGRGKKPRQNKVEVVVTPPLFDDLSMVRMGREADDVVQVMRAEGDIRTGLSSPKRYLWADDASWLEGANWHMADPADRCRTGTYAATLKGPVPPLRPRGRPRFPPRRRRAEGERVRRRDAAEAAARPARHDDRRALRDALPGLQLRQFAGLSQQVGRGGADARNPHPHAQLSQRHDPGRAERLPPRGTRRSTSSP